MSRSPVFISEAIESFYLRLHSVGWSTIPLIDICAGYNESKQFPCAAPPGIMAVATRKDPTNSKPRFYMSAFVSTCSDQDTPIRRKLFFDRMQYILPNSEKSEVDRIKGICDKDCFMIMIEGLLTLTKKTRELMKQKKDVIDRVAVGCAVITTSLSRGAVLEFCGVVDESVPFSAKKFGNGSQGEFRHRRLASVLLAACQSLAYFHCDTIELRVERVPLGAPEALLTQNGFVRKEDDKYELSVLCRKFSFLYYGEVTARNDPSSVESTPPVPAETSLVVEAAEPANLILQAEDGQNQRQQCHTAIDKVSSHQQSTESDNSDSTSDSDSSDGKSASDDCDRAPASDKTGRVASLSQSSTAGGAALGLGRLDNATVNNSNVNDVTGTAVVTQLTNDAAVEGAAAFNAKFEATGGLCPVCCAPVDNDVGVCVACGLMTHTMCSINLDMRMDDDQALLCVACHEEGYDVDQVKSDLLRKRTLRSKPPKKHDIDPDNILPTKRTRSGGTVASASSKQSPRQKNDVATMSGNNTSLLIPRRKQWTMNKVDWRKFLRGLHSIMYIEPAPGNNNNAEGKYLGKDTTGVQVQFRAHWVEEESGLDAISGVSNVDRVGLLLHLAQEEPSTWISVPKFYQEHLNHLCDLEENPEEVKKFDRCCEKHWTKIKYIRGKKQDDGSLLPGYFVLANHELTEKFPHPPDLWIATFLPPHVCGRLHPNIIDARKTGKWIELSPGSSKDTRDMTMQTTQNAPNIYFRQPGNMESCLFSSLASGLMYFGDVTAANVIGDNISVSLQHTDRLQFANHLLRTKQLKYVPKKYKREQLNVLVDQSRFPTVCILKGDDGATNHAVTIVDNWVFDSNLEKAIPLSAVTLDWCCSSPEVKAKFSSVHKALRCVCYHI